MTLFNLMIFLPTLSAMLLLTFVSWEEEIRNVWDWGVSWVQNTHFNLAAEEVAMNIEVTTIGGLINRADFEGLIEYYDQEIEASPTIAVETMLPSWEAIEAGAPRGCFMDNIDDVAWFFKNHAAPTAVRASMLILPFIGWRS